MINKILQGIFNLIMYLVNLLLSPLELALNAVIPNFSNGLSAINTWVNTIKSYLTWFISYTGLSNTTLTIIKSMLVATVSIPLAVHGFKLAIKWYNAMKV